MVLSITYDLHNPGQDYRKVHQYIVSQAGPGRYLHAEGSVWFVDSATSPETWQERLSTVTDTNDEVIVARLARNVYWGNAPKRAALKAWFGSSTRTW
jgi:hypothetical protein